jgi:hypothetical protein
VARECRDQNLPAIAAPAQDLSALGPERPGLAMVGERGDVDVGPAGLLRTVGDVIVTGRERRDIENAWANEARERARVGRPRRQGRFVIVVREDERRPAVVRPRDGVFRLNVDYSAALRSAKFVDSLSALGG